jgi:hypothetical protein
MESIDSMSVRIVINNVIYFVFLWYGFFNEGYNDYKKVFYLAAVKEELNIFLF